MRHAISAVLLALLATFALVHRAAACSVYCKPQSVAEDAAHTDAVFVGRVIKVTQRYTTFKVSRFWKGQLAKTFVLENILTDCFSSYEFKPGQTYLVFARKDFYNPADKNAAPLISGTCDRQSSIEQDRTERPHQGPRSRKDAEITVARITGHR